MGSIVSTPSVTIREETTDRIIMQLLANGNPIDLTGIHHVELEMEDVRGKTYHYSSLDASPQVEVYEATTGKVYLDPPSTLFREVLSPYQGYWWVYETATSKYSVPEELEFEIKVRENV
jgi:hypothetical protein